MCIYLESNQTTPVGSKTPTTPRALSYESVTHRLHRIALYQPLSYIPTMP
jgi:hypothetical protein